MSAQIVSFEVDDDATYNEYNVTEITYSPTLKRLCVIYEGYELYDGWNQLVFTGCERHNGQITITKTGIPIGLVPPSECTKRNTPGANDAESLYQLLTDVGIEVESFE